MAIVKEFQQICVSNHHFLHMEFENWLSVHKTEFISNKVPERLDLKVHGQRQVFNESTLFSDNITFKLHQWI